MTEREQIIMSLTEIADQPTEDGMVDGVNQQTIKGALELLKEQEPVKPRYEDFFGNRIALCGYCNGYVVRSKYCPRCGKAVKWDD